METRPTFRILLAEADEGLRGIHARLLAASGHEVFEAADDRELLAMAPSCNPHLVILGALPLYTDCIPLCRSLKADPTLKHPHIVVLCSTTDDAESMSRVLEYGADDCIPLPVSNVELLARVKVQLRLKQALVLLQREVEAHRETQAELLQSQRTLQMISEAIQDVLWLITPGLDRVVYLSPAYETVWGRSRAAVYQNPCSLLETVHPEDRQQVASAYTDYAREIPHDHQYRILRPDGELRWIHERAFFIHDAQGNFSLVAGISRDVTLERRLESECSLRESEIRLRELAEYLPHVVWLRNRDRILYVNRAYEKILGVVKEDLSLGVSSLIEYVHPEDRDRVRRTFLEEQQSDLVEDEFRILRPDGGLRWINARAVPIREEGKVVRIVGIADDVTQRREAEEALRISEAKLRQGREYYRVLAGRLICAQEEERRRLARELHDDLTQRVAYLAMEAGLLQGWQGSLPEELRCRLGELREYAAELSQDVNDLSRLIHPAVLEELGLIEAIRSECYRFQAAFDIPVQFESPSSFAEPVRDVAICLYRLVQECLRNIGKHANAGQVSVSLTFQDGGYWLTIMDNGCGFDVESARSKGGLGLASMQERVDVLQGKLTIDSRPGSGTVIGVFIPPLTGDGDGLPCRI